MFVNYMQSTVNNYSTSATGYTMIDSDRGAIVAIIMSYPTNTTEVILYTMGKPINTCEFHYVIWTTLYISCFYNKLSYETTIMQTASCRKLT